MAKGSKASKAAKGGQRWGSKASKLKPLERRAGSGHKWREEDNVWATEGEDEFHQNRDLIELEGDRAGNGNDNSSDVDLSGDEQEVFSLSLPSSSSSLSSKKARAAAAAAAEQEEEQEREGKRGKKKKARKEKFKPDLERGRWAKDLELLGKEDEEASFASGSEEDDPEQQDEEAVASEAASDSDSDDQQDDERWGASSYHVSTRGGGQGNQREGDESDSETEELELAEAMRLQKKQREGLKEGDWGLAEQLQGVEAPVAGGAKAALVGAQEEEEGTRTASRTEEEAIGQLLASQPETLALLDDSLVISSRVDKVEELLGLAREESRAKGKEHPGLGLLELEGQTLKAYHQTLLFYFALLLSPSSFSSTSSSSSSTTTKLKQTVLSRLSELRVALGTMDDLDMSATADSDSDSGSESEEDEDEDEDDGEHAAEREERAFKQAGRKGKLASDMFDDDASSSENEVSDSDSQESSSSSSQEGEGKAGLSPSEETKEVKSLLDGISEDELADLVGSLGPGAGAGELMAALRELGAAGGAGGVGGAGGAGGVGEGKKGRLSRKEKKARKLAAATTTKTTAMVIPELDSSSSKKKLRQQSHAGKGGESDFLEPVGLTMGDKADKAAAKHSLRFHVSQVAQRSRKRAGGDAAGVPGGGGDEDVPRRNKERARREVLKQQSHAVAGAGGKEGERLDGQDWGEEDRRRAREVMDFDLLAAAGEDDLGEEGGGGKKKGGNSKKRPAADEEAPEEDYYDLVAASKASSSAAKKARYDSSKLDAKAERFDLVNSSSSGPREATRQIMANKGLTPRRPKANRNPRVKKRLMFEKAEKKVKSQRAVYDGGLGKLGGKGYQGEKSGIGGGVVKSRKL